MSKSEQAGVTLVAAAQKAAQKNAKAKQKTQLRAFIGEYFVHVPAQDLAEFNGNELAAIATSHLKTGASRKPKTSKIRG